MNENVSFPLIGLPAFYMSAAPTIPSFYWDVVSDEQRVKEICCRLGSLIEYVKTLTDGENQLAEDLQDLKTLFEKFQESGFDDYYKEQVEEWVAANLDYVFNNVAKQVYFGINEQGYFTAYIPSGWSDIIFDTGYDYSLDTYGRLILRWNVNGSPYTVDQTPETRKV